jgi:hypothetical protein
MATLVSCSSRTAEVGTLSLIRVLSPRLLLQVTLLDPVRFPGAIKVFAREICRNDLLNFGRLHFFFPDSRLALDLSTDKTLKEARFDRHFVRVSHAFPALSPIILS